MSNPIRINGFTNETLKWNAWLDTVVFATATPQQVAALEEMSPTAKESNYFLLLAHQPDMLPRLLFDRPANQLLPSQTLPLPAPPVLTGDGRRDDSRRVFRFVVPRLGASP